MKLHQCAKLPGAGFEVRREGAQWLLCMYRVKADELRKPIKTEDWRLHFSDKPTAKITIYHCPYCGESLW
jgi:hypothetical protein